MGWSSLQPGTFPAALSVRSGQCQSDQRRRIPRHHCAFVLDLLASLTAEAETAARYRMEADTFRETLAARLDGGNLWAAASRAEALVGLERIDDAKAALRQYAQYNPAPWELETTLRQFVRLGNLRGIEEAKVLHVLAMPLPREAPASEQRYARLTSVLVGRVGLALSGGGFRASLYHLGVLARLAESDVLRHVETLSCVSEAPSWEPTTTSPCASSCKSTANA